MTGKVSQDACLLLQFNRIAVGSKMYPIGIKKFQEFILFVSAFSENLKLGESF